MTNNSWKSQAACFGLTSDLFFGTIEIDPDTGEEQQENPSPQAKRVCADCTVASFCLDNAVGFPSSEDYGTRAGTGRNHRRHFRRLRLKAGHAYRPACACEYCEAIPEWVGQMREAEQSENVAHFRPLNSNGEGAKCGRIATYGRGCRCNACSHTSSLRDFERRASSLAKKLAVA